MNDTLQELLSELETQPTDTTIIGLSPKVVVHNDEIHTFEEVALQIAKATGCSFDRGMKFADEIDRKGRAIVFSGEIDKCLVVSSILEEIALHTQIET